MTRLSKPTLLRAYTDFAIVVAGSLQLFDDAPSGERKLASSFPSALRAVCRYIAAVEGPTQMLKLRCTVGSIGWAMAAATMDATRDVQVCMLRTSRIITDTSRLSDSVLTPARSEYSTRYLVCTKQTTNVLEQPGGAAARACKDSTGRCVADAIAVSHAREANMWSIDPPRAAPPARCAAACGTAPRRKAPKSQPSVGRAAAPLRRRTRTAGIPKSRNPSWHPATGGQHQQHAAPWRAFAQQCCD